MDYDLIIVGGGPVGLALARAVRDASVAVVARPEPLPYAPMDGVDARVYALSPGNVDFLAAIGAWQNIPVERVTPVHSMRVHGDQAGAKIVFDAYRAGVPELAWTVEDRVLQGALVRAVQAADHVETIAADVDAMDLTGERASVRLSDGRMLRAPLLVGADGARSAVRQAAGIAVRESDYGQRAVVANFRCAKPHGNAAYQWFQGGPVLALLPLPGAVTSMIWSLPEEKAKRVLSLSPGALCEAVEAASQAALGSLALETAPRSYSLRRLAARRLVAPHVALAGDAAHVIHPLAGQGLNIGLQDARELAAVLAQRAPTGDPGDLALLRRYERSRAEPILAMDFTVDGLYRLFGARTGVLARLRNDGLNLAGRLPVLKNLLVRHAMR